MTQEWLEAVADQIVEHCEKHSSGSLQPAGSDASASDSRIAKPKEQWCLKGHSAICDTLCKLWCCKHEHQEALLAPRPNSV